MNTILNYSSRSHTPHWHKGRPFFSVSIARCFSLVLLLASTTLLGQPQSRYPNLQFSLTPFSELTSDSILEEINTLDPLPNSLVQDEISHYEAERLRLSENYGPFSSEHLNNLSSLGKAYQLQGEHELAIEAFDQALQIVRIGKGLFSSEQFPYVDAMAESHIALNDRAEADDLKALKYHIALKAFEPGSDALQLALNEYADWNIEHFTDNYLFLHQPTSSYGRSSSLNNRNVNNGLFGTEVDLISPSVLRDGHFTYIRTSRYLSKYSKTLSNAEDTYQSMVEPYSSDNSSSDNDPSSNNLETNSTIIEAQLQLAKIAWYRHLELNLYVNHLPLEEGKVILHQDIRQMELSHYRSGIEALSKRLSYIEDSNASIEDSTNALLDLADWHLAFDFKKDAKQLYLQAHQQLTEAGYSDEAIVEFLHPDDLILIPTFVSHQYEALPDFQSPSTTGYMVVGIDLKEDGTIRNTSINEYSENANLNIRNILRNHLRFANFRPFFNNAEMIKQDNLNLRFYFQF